MPPPSPVQVYRRKDPAKEKTRKVERQSPSGSASKKSRATSDDFRVPAGPKADMDGDRVVPIDTRMEERLRAAGEHMAASSERSKEQTSNSRPASDGRRISYGSSSRTSRDYAGTAITIDVVRSNDGQDWRRYPCREPGRRAEI